MDVRVQEAGFDIGAELEAFRGSVVDAGAIVSFTGVTRDLASGDLKELLIEHYPGMTEKAILAIRSEAMERFTLSGARIVHRFGTLAPGEVIMMVLTAAPHRSAAFDGASFLMDYLKSRAPFWKQERAVGGVTWVAAKDEDETALSRW